MRRSRLSFVVYGPALRARLLWLAASLAIGLTLCFAATIPPSHYLLGGCDALSAAHLVGGLAGATALAALAVGVPHLRTRLTRTLAVAAAGTFTLAAVALTYPACFRDPLAGVDPFVMEIWLSQVREAMPMMRIVATRPELLPIIALPVVLGFIAALYAIWQTRGIVRTRWIILAALIGVGLVTAFWQIRVFSSAAPLAALPASYVVLRSPIAWPAASVQLRAHSLPRCFVCRFRRSLTHWRCRMMTRAMPQRWPACRRKRWRRSQHCLLASCWRRSTRGRT